MAELAAPAVEQHRHQFVVFRRQCRVAIDINHIDGAVLIPWSSIDSGDGLARLPADRIPVLYCKTGVRSAEILPVVQRAGYPQARHLRGGISAWAEAFAPDMVMY